MAIESQVSKTSPGLAGTVELATKLGEAIAPGAEVLVSLENAPDLLVSDLQTLAAAHLSAAAMGARLSVDLPRGGRLETAILRAGFDSPTDAELTRLDALWTGVNFLEGTER